MQIVIDISEDVYTRLFDNGIQDNEIVVDDVCEMVRALRLGIPLEKHDEEVIKETVESIWGKPPYTELLDKIKAEIDHIPTQIWEENKMTYILASYYKKQVFEVIDKYRKEQE